MQRLRAKWLRRPPAGASEAERLRFVRRTALAQLPWIVVFWIVLLAVSTIPSWGLIFAVVGTAVTVWSLVAVSLRLRRLERD